MDAMKRMDVTALVASVIPDSKLTIQFFTTIEQAPAQATAAFQGVGLRTPARP